MKYLSIAVFATLSSLIFAQNNHTDSLYRMSKIKLGINFSADRCFRGLENTNGSSTSGFVLGFNNQNELPKFGFTTGLNICYSISKHFSLDGGIQYSNKGYQMEMKNLIYAQPNPSLPTEFHNKYNFHYIDIPLKINFISGKNKVRFFASAGITTNIFLQEIQVSRVKYADGRTEKSSGKTNFDYNSINLSPTISAGIDCKLNEKSNLRIEPTFRYGILSIIDAPIAGYLWSTGLNVSYYFRPDFLLKKK